MSNPKRKISARERVARNLRSWREKRGLSQEKLSADAGLSQTFLSQVENGLRNVSIDKLEQLAEVLDVDIADLLTP